MADDRRVNLDELIKRRDRLRDQVSRLQGKLESARADLAQVEDDCRKKGVPPEKLDAAIAELTRRHDTAVADFTSRIEGAEKAIKPFLEDRP